MNKTRYGNRDKRRKTNVVLNALIGIVLILILAVGYQLILGGEKEETSNSKISDQQETQSEEPAADQEDNASDEAENKDKETQNTSGDEQSAEDKAADEKAKEEEKQKNEKEQSEDPNEGATVTEGEPGSDVAEVIENPNWKPVGTTQEGDHTAVYDKGSTDWQEMTKALTAATGVQADNMTIWRLENNGSPDDAIGTISAKGSDEKLRVSIQFVENEGWKPVKVEKLK
ncbi:YrrS family protein [Metabacillus sp. 84]|uniref:YrrS family protein n=1 Tax=Metabacillus sp. 84 TaxID=3404705 RepID=UPI003CE7498A